MIVDLIVPAGIDDPARPSGGNTYDRRVCRGLAEAGWSIREHRVTGGWPFPDESDRAGLGAVLSGLPRGGVALIDGLIASAALAELPLIAAAGARLVVLVHLPLGVAAPNSPTAVREREALACADVLIVTSRWTRDWLIDHYDLPGDRLSVAEPGVDSATLTRPSLGGGRLLCVGALAPHKGQDVLVAALETATARGFEPARSGLGATARGFEPARSGDGVGGRPDWRCELVGAEVDPAYARSVRDRVAAAGLDDRVSFLGPLTPAELSARYADTDLLVVPSRIETYGMVVLEAFARGIPVVATTAGGLPRTLDLADDGTGPGLLVPPDDPDLLADALHRWLTDDTVRRRLRDDAAARRATLPAWSTTLARVAATLSGVAA